MQPLARASQRAVALAVLGVAALMCRAQQAATSRPATQPAGDWPLWGGSPERNPVSSARGLPHTWDVADGTNIRWSTNLGTQTYGGPVIAGNCVLVGTNNGGELRPAMKGDKGIVLCFEATTNGATLRWQATHDKLAAGPPQDWPEQGVASSPLVDGDRVYYVSNRCELVCADLAGFQDGENDGPYRDERHTDSQDADFVWVLDMIGQLGVYPHNLAACAPVSDGKLVFVCTSNGVDEDHEIPPKPDAPSFIAVDKATGRVVWQRTDPGRQILHGQWSSPAYGVIDGVGQVIFGGGDGWTYSFAPATGALLWKFDLNPKDAVWDVGGSGTKTSIVATPVVHGNHVYIAAGDDPESASGPGHLYAIDAARRGDITESGRVWHFGGRDFGRTIASVAVADGLVYAVDLDGYLNCLEAATGTRVWRYDMKAAVWATPCVADGKVYLGNVDGDVAVLAAGRELKELSRIELPGGIYTSMAVAHDALYVATTRRLFCIGLPK